MEDLEQKIGIAALGLSLPSSALGMEELAQLRGQDPAKYIHGLGCREMALCQPGEDVVDLATRAARRALQQWGGDPQRIGLLAVGTESALDMSRPLSAWVADNLGLKGDIRSYEVKHACYGGTLALRQALEWRWANEVLGSTHKPRPAALVIAADVALYAPGDPGEPTQGAGAVAFVIDDARLATVGVESYPWSEPAFDFWRPVGEDFPQVDGPFSLECYCRAAEHCFTAWVGKREPKQTLDSMAAFCFHVPFPKMVQKAVRRVTRILGLDDSESKQLFASKVAPTMEWNRLSGNAYTASLWIAVARALCEQPEGANLAAFSYGSGFGAELLTLRAGPDANVGAWVQDLQNDLDHRSMIDTALYSQWRGEHLSRTA